jgi:hypothetical protein
MADDWAVYLRTADEWIVNYSLPILNLTSVKLFSVGHALELYLKASIAKLTGDVDAAVNFGHDIPAIWERCKQLDSSFLPAFELRKTILARDLLDHGDYSQLEKYDLLHFLRHQELYVVAKYLADLKYLGAPLKKIKGAYAIAVFFPNPEWPTLFASLRRHLGHPEEGKLDVIQYHIEESALPPFSIQFLKDIVSPSAPMPTA